MQFATLRMPRKKHRFGPSSNPPRLPTFLQPSRTPAPATHFVTCQELNFQSAPTPSVLNGFDFRIALAPQRGANFGDIFGSRTSAPPRFSELTLGAFEATKLWKKQSISHHFAQFLL